MAGIDHSIYFQAKPLDIFGSVQRGLEMRNTLDQRELQKKEREKQAQIDQAYQAGVVQNPDGTYSYDNNLAMSRLAGVSGAGRNAFEFNQQMINQKREEQKYQDALKQQEFENQYKRDALVNDAANRAYARNFDREKFNFEKSKALIDQQKKVQSGENLPLDQKKMVETLSSKNANKIAIKNQIDAVMSNWDNLSEDQQVAAGRQLLKTLNSTEGADAIGSEEAARLGSKLEFAMGNFANSNPTQFGRDLKGFAEQARNTSKSIGNAVGMNQGQIDSIMGRSQLSGRPSDPITPSAGGVVDGYRFKGGDPSRQENWEKI